MPEAIEELEITTVKRLLAEEAEFDPAGHALTLFDRPLEDRLGHQAGAAVVRSASLGDRVARERLRADRALLVARVGEHEVDPQAVGGGVVGRDRRAHRALPPPSRLSGSGTLGTATFFATTVTSPIR